MLHMPGGGGGGEGGLGVTPGTSMLLGQSLMSVASVSGGGAEALLHLSRTDQLELEEVRRTALGILAGHLQLRLEQNLLTKYIDSWMKRKHAIALLRMDS